MIRLAGVVAVALCLSTSMVHAQNVQFTVSVTSAGVYQTPGSDGRVIGHKSKGEVLEVRRNLGSWVEVTWPAAEKGVAYVSTSAGSIGQPAAQQPARPMTIAEYLAAHSATTSTTATPVAASRPMTIAEYAAMPAAASGATATTPATTSAAASANARGGTQGGSSLAQPMSSYVAPAHFVGIGGRLGDTRRTLAVTGRAWSRERIGFQLEVSHDSSTNDITAERVTSLQIAPSVLYALPNEVSDYVWLRPYVGGGATIYRSTLSSVTPGVADSVTDGALGLQLFGGGEITFAAVPQFAVSADVRYRKSPTPFPGFERRKIGVTLSGHWFVR